MKLVVLFIEAVWEAIRDREWVDIAAQPWMAFPGSLDASMPCQAGRLKQSLSDNPLVRIGMPKGAKSGASNPPKGSSGDITLTPAPKGQSVRQEALRKNKRQKVDAPPDDDAPVSDAHELLTDSTDGQDNGGLTMEEILMVLEDDEEDFDFDDHSSDEQESSEIIRQVVLKVEGLAKNVSNLAELRTLLGQLPHGQLLGQLKSWTAIIAATPSIGKVEVLKKWVQSDLSKDDFMYLLKGYILPEDVKTKVRTRGDDFDTVLSIILEMKSHQNRALTKEKVDRSDWKYCDWLASTLQRVYERNEGDCDSIFAGAKVDDKRKYVIYFATIRQALSEDSKSRRDRLWSTLAITEDEKKELITLFPHLKGSFASVSQWAHPVKAIHGSLSQGLFFVLISADL
jgi:hypothetical protein